MSPSLDDSNSAGISTTQMERPLASLTSNRHAWRTMLAQFERRVCFLPKEWEDKPVSKRKKNQQNVDATEFGNNLTPERVQSKISPRSLPRLSMLISPDLVHRDSFPSAPFALPDQNSRRLRPLPSWTLITTRPVSPDSCYFSASDSTPVGPIASVRGARYAAANMFRGVR